MAWTILPRIASSQPELLVKTRFSEEGYSVHVTDLSRVWSETLSKDDIILRAAASGSSVDPSEDDDQFSIFLAKLQSALNRESGTSLRLASEDGAALLQLHLTAPLPHPLPLFKWNFRLELQPERRIESELVTPLMLLASGLRRKIRHLIDQLYDKDRVISKICDRLETSGNDLTAVFPGASNIKISRKKAQREQLAKHVKGLGDFDEEAWRKQDVTIDSGGRLSADDVNDVFSDMPPELLLPPSDSSENWWERLAESNDGSSGSPSVIPSSQANFKHSEHKSVENGVAPLHGHMHIDEFQRQDTPPQRKRRNSLSSDVDIVSAGDEVDRGGDGNQAQPVKDDVEDSTTDEEDDLDAPPPKQRSTQEAPLRSPSKETIGSAKGLGMMGGHRPQPQPQPPSPDTTGPEEDIQTEQRRPKLGTLGGKARQPRPSDEQGRPVTESTPPKVSKLGIIGGKATQNVTVASTHTARDSPRPGERLVSGHPDTPDKKESPQLEEDPEALADRKRDQLKRDLEEKAKVPVKKKRKF